jgi:hypothetical protein
MKSRLNAWPLFVLLGFVTMFSSCKDDDDDDVARPVIDGLEVGIGDSRKAFIGSDLHLQAELIAEGRIDQVVVEIHSEDGGDYEIEVVYDEFAGQKNATFHKHIDIPSEAPAGSYHLHLTVTDQAGGATIREVDITIEELEDEEAPVLNVTSAPESGQSFAAGQTISISATVTDNSSLSGLLVALVYETDNIADADVTGGNASVIVMLHTHAFYSPESHSFTASIEVGAANDNNMTPVPIAGDNAWKSGSYYLLIRSKDAKGNWVNSGHFPVVVNL